MNVELRITHSKGDKDMARKERISKELMNQAMKNAMKQNALEDKIAMEWYGCSFDELGYDDKELVAWEAQDRMEV
jgi:hypothetical protein